MRQSNLTEMEHMKKPITKKPIMKKQINTAETYRKLLARVAALSLILSVTACGMQEGASWASLPDRETLSVGSTAGASGSSVDASGKDGGQEKPGALAPSQAAGELRFLCTEDGDTSCATQEGYYYISTEPQKLQDKSLGYCLMYMDYASCREVYLCSAPGCGHDTKDCTAVLPYEAFPAHTSKLFLYQGALYLLSRQYDADGTYATSLAEGEIGLGSVSSVNPMPAALYRMNPDGTGREKVFSFDPDLTLEGVLALDGQGLYAVTKKLSSQKTGTGEYTSSSQRTLVYLDLSSYDLSQECSLEFGDHIDWKLTGCANGSFLLKGIDYGRSLTEEERFGDDDAYLAVYEKSHTVFALLDTASGSPREFYRIGNQETHSEALLNGTLYVSSGKEILGIDVSSGKETLLSTHPQNYIMGTIGNMLCCTNLEDFTDHTYYFVDVDTGEIRHSGLTNQSLGWRLDLIAETDSDVLVIYDYDAVTENGESYEIRRYLYGLISKEDLFSGRENYRKIQMTGKGH